VVDADAVQQRRHVADEGAGGSWVCQGQLRGHVACGAAFRCLGLCRVGQAGRRHAGGRHDTQQLGCLPGAGIVQLTGGMDTFYQQAVGQAALAAA
jgi:hypothetical protein